MRSPSLQLVELLKRLDLCKSADIRACYPLVRRLARDLPAFDSVWVDALVQLRRLTPYQGEVVLSNEPDSLNAGPVVIVDKLGRHDTAHTFLARRRDADDKCVVKYVDPTDDRFERISTNLDQLAQAFRKFSHQAIAGPHASLEFEERLVAVSRYVPGASIRDTLIQTGRFRPTDVIEIGRQILSGLAEMERHWPAHGDIRIANLRLALDGTACLVNCGIAVAAERRFIVHHRLRPDRCDTVARELIGTDRTPDAQSDLYALGCLLWQLLCGRPPFPFADPLEKLAAHQTQDVADVREIAPDTPDWLADAITHLTRRERTERPPSFTDASRRWNQHTAARLPKANALNRFSPRIREMARRSATPKQASNKLLAATVLIAVTGATLLFTNGQGQSLFQSATATEPDIDKTAMRSDVDRGPALLPPADANGVIQLPNAGPWLATRIESPVPLTIRGPVDQPAVIECKEPLALQAPTVTMEHLTFVGDTTPSLIDCTTRTVRGSRLTLVGRRTPVGVKWTSSDERDRSARGVTITDSTFRGIRAAIEVRSPAADVNLGNVLAVDGRSMVRIASPATPGSPTTCRLLKTTVRGMAHAIESTLPPTDTTPSNIAVVLGDSVFALEGSNAAAFAFIGPVVPRVVSPVLRTSSHRNADASLLSANSKFATWFNPLTNVLGDIPEDFVATEDLVRTPLRFEGDDLSNPNASQLVDFEAPRTSTAMPGWSSGRSNSDR